MSKTQFDEKTRDQIRDLTQLAHHTLNRIKNISREKGGGLDNPLGFLGLILLFCSMIQGLALQEGVDMTQALVSRLMEKVKKRQEVRYVA